MNAPTLRSSLSQISKACRSGSLAWIVLFAGTTACVTENTTTGEMVPRGNQRHPWAKVQELAKDLKKGMTKAQTMVLMGSPAEGDETGDQWIYLPERYGILIPAQALRLEFKDRVLVDFGYRAIVLGTQL